MDAIIKDEIDNLKKLGLESVEVKSEKVKEKSQKEKKIEQIRKIKKLQQELENDVLHTKLEDLNSEIFKELDAYIEMMNEGIIQGLVIEGDAGSGKSTKVTNKLEGEIAYLGNFTTPTQFYCWLHEKQNIKNKVVDDCEGIWNNKKSIAILKSLLWGVKGRRLVSYNTTKPLEDSEGNPVDLSYEEKGNIVLIANNIPKNNKSTKDDVKAVASRVKYVEIRPTKDQWVRILAQLAERPYKNLDKNERMEVLDYIKEHISEGSVDINLRTLCHCFDLRIHSKVTGNMSMWKELSKSLLENIDVSKLINELHARPELKDADIFSIVAEKTGISKATYYRIKESLNLSVRTGNKNQINKLKAKKKKEEQQEAE